jgi:oxygen-dependent protoporphyrinogen oxidase
MPQLRDAERSHRSLLLAGLAAGRTLREAARGHANGTVASGPTGGNGRHGGALEGSTATTNPVPTRPTSLFLTLAGGMGELVDALRTSLERAPQPVDVRTGSTVDALEVAAAAYRAHLSDGSSLRAEAVVLTVPAWAAARILGIALPAAVRALRSIPFGSSLAVSLGFREDQLTAPLRGHGYLVPPAEDRSISACTWSSEKWTARAPAGFVLIRAFVRSPDAALLAATDETLVGAVRADLERTMGVRGAPVLANVARWPDAMPRYTVGHLDRVLAVETALAALPGIVVAGASYRGVGLPDCVAQGRAAAAQVLGWLGEGSPTESRTSRAE